MTHYTIHVIPLLCKKNDVHPDRIGLNLFGQRYRPD